MTTAAAGESRKPSRKARSEGTTEADELPYKPQEGPQKKFFGTKADIAIYGGAAGGGKTWALLLEAQRHHEEPDFSAVVFRRNTVQVRNPGGLWDESLRLYPAVGGEPFTAVLEWRFPSGAKVKFAHLEHDKTVLEWQGAQLPLICFDELAYLNAGHPNPRRFLAKPEVRPKFPADLDVAAFPAPDFD